jgi:hypothetical protein
VKVRVAATMAAEADTTVRKLGLQALQERLTAGGQLLRLKEDDFR